MRPNHVSLSGVLRPAANKKVIFSVIEQAGVTAPVGPFGTLYPVVDIAGDNTTASPGIGGHSAKIRQVKEPVHEAAAKDQTVPFRGPLPFGDLGE